MIWLPFLGWLWLAGLLAASAAGADIRRHHFEAAGLAFGAGLLLFLMWLLRARTRLDSLSPSSARGRGWHLLVPPVVAVVAFGWSLALGPLSDDFVLHQWAVSRDWTPAEWDYVRPVPLALWWVISTLSGGWGALHLLNLGLHALNAALVARIVGLLSGRRTVALVAGVVVAAFPASTEAVAWTAGVFDLSATACVLAAVLSWLTLEASGRKTAVLCVLLLVGLLCKESAIALPILLLMLAALSSRGTSGLRRNATTLAWLVAIAALFLVMRGASGHDVQEHLTSLPRDGREVKDVLVRPFASLALPVRTDEHVGPQVYVAGGIVLLIVGVLLGQLNQRSRASTGSSEAPERAAMALFGVAWIGVSAVPLLTQFHVGPNLEGSRFLYLPAVGFALLIAAAMPRAGRILRPTFAAALTLLLSLYGLRLIEEQRIWSRAAETRDALLQQSAALASESPCRSLRVLDPPDSVRGAYVFRVGIDEALRAIQTRPEGTDCTFQWLDGKLVVAPPGL